MGQRLGTPISGNLINCIGYPGVSANTTAIAALESIDHDTRALAIAATIPVATNYVRIAGYASAGDGGAALYKRVVSLATDCYGFQSADGAWWQLAELDVYPQMMGAKDDVSAYADTQIQAAIDHVVAIGIGTVQLRGRFALSASLSIEGKVAIRGANRTFTILYPDAGLNVFSINTADAVIIEGLSIQYGTPGTTSAIYVTCPTSTVNNNSTILRDLFINNSYIGIDIVSAALFTIDNCQIRGTLDCIRINNTAAVDAGDSIISNCWLAGTQATTTGILWYAGGGLRVSGCKIIDHLYGVQINMTNTVPAIAGLATAGMTFSNNNIEGCTGSAFDIRRQGSSATLGSVVVSGGHSAGCPALMSVPVDASGAWLTGLTVTGVCWTGPGSGTNAFATIDSVVGFTIANNTLIASGGTTYKVITGSAADRGVVGPNIGVGTFTASSFSSTNTTQIAPT
jgi:hypothetical protein